MSGDDVVEFKPTVLPSPSSEATLSVTGSATVGRRGSVLINRNASTFARIEAAPLFQNSTLAVICINAVWIFIDVQYNHSRLADENGRLPLQPLSTFIENAFCLYFTVEVVIRFLAFQSKLRFIFDAWFVFDSILVMFMVIETWVMPVAELLAGDGEEGTSVLGNLSSFRLLRLLRLTRMARVMRFFPELLTIVKGIVNAVRAVFFIQLFLVLVMYIFAIIFTSQLGQPGGRHAEPGNEDGDPTALMMFDSIGSSMMTLFTNGVLGDNLAQTLDAIKDAKACHTYLLEETCPAYCQFVEGECVGGRRLEGLILMWLFLCFMMISSITLLNMLIGVLCQVVDDTARSELEANQILELQACLSECFQLIDANGNGVISAKEWRMIGESEEMRKSLEKLGIETADVEERLLQMQHTLFGIEDPQLEDKMQKEDTIGKSFGIESPTAQSRGVTFDQFVTKISDLRWDTPTSALDLEMLKRHVQLENKAVNKRLDQIEDKLERVLVGIMSSEGTSSVTTSGPMRSIVSPSPQASPQSPASQTAADPAAGGGGGGDGALSLSSTTLASPTSTANRAGNREAGGGHQNGGNSQPGRPLALWEVPTELLFHTLCTRVG
eukprot:TRINITY_DN37986_c0_g2_i1.p1 TRINITY_DN37986_c0_g2~~TRINITY_DN37986_c0_g2_i1.p1  ORF type:complete len:610 (-),score=131.48 TRINITY_DN37986_c0_g2_i1:89-1918(-)